MLIAFFHGVNICQITNNVYNVGNLTSTMQNYGIGYVTAPNYTLLNSYYKNQNDDNSSITGSNGSGTTSLTNDVMKNQSYMTGSKYFYQVLNDNISNIDLNNFNNMPEIMKEKLKDMTLVKWKIGENGYPTLDF